MEIVSYSRKDYSEVIEFLSQLYRLDSERPYWLPARWEYATYLCSPLFQELGYPDWIEFMRIVRDGNSILGIVNSENPDHNVFLHTHPEHKYLEDELVAWAEENFKTETVSVWTLSDDAHRRAMLEARGYIKEEKNDYLNWCELDEHEPVAPLPEGLEISSFAKGFDLDSRIECSAGAFDSERFSKEVYCFMQKAPNYDPALDLVLKDGEKVVSLCTVWQDRENSLGYFEPVATAPAYQRKGLGFAILNEGMRRLKERKVKRAYVGSYGDWRRKFYIKAGFTRSVLCNPWTKRRE